MTHQEWETATDEERQAEYERCKDPVYLYNNYMVKSDGTKPDPITQEQWEALQKWSEQYRSKYRVRRY